MCGLMSGENGSSCSKRPSNGLPRAHVRAPLLTPACMVLHVVGNTEIVQLLLARGVAVDKPIVAARNFTPLMFAAFHLRVETVEVLIRANASLEAQSSTGEDALTIALGRKCGPCQKGNCACSCRSAVVTVILDAMADNKRRSGPADGTADAGATAGREGDDEEVARKKRRRSASSLVTQMR